MFPVKEEISKEPKVKSAQFSLLSRGPEAGSDQPEVRHSEPAAKVAATLLAGGTCASLLCLGALTTFHVEYDSNRRRMRAVTLLKTFCFGECWCVTAIWQCLSCITMQMGLVSLFCCIGVVIRAC